jgi:hypothetical protein
MPSYTIPSRRRAILVCAFVALTAGMCAALLSAAALVPAPPMILPFLVVICIGCPMVAACELPGAVAELRATRPSRPSLDPREVETLRRELESLPETPHPLGL